MSLACKILNFSWQCSLRSRHYNKTSDSRRDGHEDLSTSKEPAAEHKIGWSSLKKIAFSPLGRISRGVLEHSTKPFLSLFIIHLLTRCRVCPRSGLYSLRNSEIKLCVCYVLRKTCFSAWNFHLRQMLTPASIREKQLAVSKLNCVLFCVRHQKFSRKMGVSCWVFKSLCDLLCVILCVIVSLRVDVDGCCHNRKE